MDDRYAAVKDKRFDVMLAVKPLCKVKPTPGMRQKKGFKMPKLVEAVEILLKRDHKGAHRAMADCRATAELYWYVKERLRRRCRQRARCRRGQGHHPRSSAGHPQLR